jgi:hypothetical protein
MKPTRHSAVLDLLLVEVVVVCLIDPGDPTYPYTVYSRMLKYL